MARKEMTPEQKAAKATIPEDDDRPTLRELREDARAEGDYHGPIDDYGSESP